MSAPDKAPENPQLEKDVVTEDTDAAQSEIDGNEEDDEEEEKGECGFCLFMKGGGCKENFIAWENCINKAEEKKDGIAEKCFDITSALKTCMLAHPDYYEPILRAEKAAEEEAIKELDKEKAAETADNKEEVVIELENQKAAQETSKTAPAESSSYAALEKLPADVERNLEGMPQSWEMANQVDNIGRALFPCFPEHRAWRILRVGTQLSPVRASPLQNTKEGRHKAYIPRAYTSFSHHSSYNLFMNSWLRNVFMNSWLRNVFMNSWLRNVFMNPWLRNVFMNSWLRNEDLRHTQIPSFSPIGVTVNEAGLSRPAYKWQRVLLKVGGEALAGDHTQNIDPKVTMEIAREVASVTRLGIEVAIVVGGGNIFRGASWAGSSGLDCSSADYIRMLATVMNSIFLHATMESIGIPTRVQTAFHMSEVAEPYMRRRAVRHLEKGRVVIFAAGTGNPFFTMDTAAALRVAEINAEVVLKATNVDGVYEEDPRHNPNARLLDTLTYQEVTSKDLAVMDMTAITLCQENKIPAMFGKLFSLSVFSSHSWCIEYLTIMVSSYISSVLHCSCCVQSKQTW